MQKKQQGGKIREWMGFFGYVLILFLLAFLVIQFVGQRTRVNGMSMEPTLSNGDNLIIDKLSYRLHEPKRYDVIVFPYQYEDGKYYIKRIIGLPGERIRIDTDGRIFINGEVLEESYGKETIEDPGSAENEITLGADEYFVLGDNRNNSSDSRMEDVGTIRRKNIIGRAWFRIYPFDKIGRIH